MTIDPKKISETANLPGVPDVSLPEEPLAPEQIAAITAAMFAPTADRMATLIQHLVRSTTMAEHVFMAPAAALAKALPSITFDVAPRKTGIELVLFGSAVLARLSEMLIDMAAAAAQAPRAPFPALREWTEQDTIDCYTEARGGDEASDRVNQVHDALETMLDDAPAVPVTPSKLRSELPDLLRLAFTEAEIAALAPTIAALSDADVKTVSDWTLSQHAWLTVRRADGDPEPERPACLTPPTA